MKSVKMMKMKNKYCKTCITFKEVYCWIRLLKIRKYISLNVLHWKIIAVSYNLFSLKPIKKNEEKMYYTFKKSFSSKCIISLLIKKFIYILNYTLKTNFFVWYNLLFFNYFNKNWKIMGKNITLMKSVIKNEKILSKKYYNKKNK